MTAPRLFVKAANGLVHISNPALDFDALETLLAEYRAADKAADDDYNDRRYTRHEHQSRPAADSAADDVRDEAGLQMTWQQILDWIPDLELAAAEARRQQQATEAAARINPLLKGA